MSGIGDFFKKLFENLGNNDQSRQPITGRDTFSIQRPQIMGNDLPSQGGYGGNLGGDPPNGSILEMLGKQRGSLYPPNQPSQPDTSEQTDQTPAMSQYGTYTPGPVTASDTTPNVADAKYNEIMGILGKDYSKKRNPNYDPNQPKSADNQPYILGKDTATHHGIMDILKGIGLGALQGAANIKPGSDIGTSLGALIGGAGAGGVGEGIDRNANSKMLDDIKMQKLLPEYQQAYGLQQQRINDALKQAQTQAQTANIGTDNQRLQMLAEEKAKHDRAMEDYWGRKADQGDLKVADTETLMKLRDKWAGMRDKVSQARVKIADGELAERIRHNQTTEKQAATNEAGRTTRQQAAAELQKQITQQKADLAEVKATKDQQRKLELQNAIKERQLAIKKASNNLDLLLKGRSPDEQQ